MVTCPFFKEAIKAARAMSSAAYSGCAFLYICYPGEGWLPNPLPQTQTCWYNWYGEICHCTCLASGSGERKLVTPLPSPLHFGARCRKHKWTCNMRLFTTSPGSQATQAGALGKQRHGVLSPTPPTRNGRSHLHTIPGPKNNHREANDKQIHEIQKKTKKTLLAPPHPPQSAP